MGMQLVGTIVEDRYRIEAQLGAGAMGAVYRGRHVKVGRTVAIKVMHDHLVRDEAMVERFQREAQLAARLRHRNLVSVIDIGPNLIVFELAPGRSMTELLTGPMPRERVIDLTRQLLSGLEHAHGAGLIHRDLKPENVLVDDDGVARIVDFGIAVLRQDVRCETRRLTCEGVVLGTPMYMSPEQAMGIDVDERTDLFALGVMVFEMLAGATPFEGSGVEVMMQNISCDAPSIATRTGRHVDAALEAFARKLMARSLEDRFASATEALAALEAIARCAVPEVIEERVTKRERVAMQALVAPPSPSRRRWGAVLAAVAAVLAGFAMTRC
jgi:serine/threonine-protein kinase